MFNCARGTDRSFREGQVLGGVALRDAESYRTLSCGKWTPIPFDSNSAFHGWQDPTQLTQPESSSRESTRCQVASGPTRRSQCRLKKAKTSQLYTPPCLRSTCGTCTPSSTQERSPYRGDSGRDHASIVCHSSTHRLEASPTLFSGGQTTCSAHRVPSTPSWRTPLRRHQSWHGESGSRTLPIIGTCPATWDPECFGDEISDSTHL